MYESYYGFHAQPFQLRPDPDFLYGSKGHKRALAYLDYGLARGEGFIVVTGEVGAGKTTLLRHLLHAAIGQDLRGADRHDPARRRRPLAHGRGRLRIALRRLEQGGPAVEYRPIAATSGPPGQARPAGDRRGAKPQRPRGRGIAHAVEFPDFRPGPAANLPAGPAGIPQDPDESGHGAAAPTGDRHLPPGADGGGGNAALHRTPPGDGRLERTAIHRRGRLRGDPRGQRRRAAPYQHLVRPPAADGLPGEVDQFGAAHVQTVVDDLAHEFAVPQEAGGTAAAAPADSAALDGMEARIAGIERSILSMLDAMKSLVGQRNSQR